MFARKLLPALLIAAGFAVQAAELVVPVAADYASIELNNPWDMQDSADVNPLLWVHNLSAATLSGNAMNGTPVDTDAHFWPLFPHIPSSTATLDQPIHLINADKYTKLAFYMWLPENLATGERNGRVLWHVGGDTVAKFETAYSEAPIFPVYPGWHLYTMDLKSVTQTAGYRWAGPWAGQIAGLRIDPSLGAQLPFKIGWIRLIDASDNTSRLNNAAVKAGALLVKSDLHAKDTLVTSLLAQADGSFDFASLPYGSYKVAPISDEDYALAYRGKGWDMSTLTDFNWATRNNWKNEGIANAQFQGATAGPDPFLLMDIPQDRPIDASKYRYLRIKMELSNVPDQESGLLVWFGNKPVDFSAGNSGFIPVSAGVKEYTIDLGSKAGWSGLIKALRIDPLNGPNAGSGVTVKISSVRLTKTADSAPVTVNYLSDTVRVNTPPTATILAPAFNSGNDYARLVKGKIWDFKDSYSVPDYRNLLNADYVTSIPDLNLSGTFFRGVSQPAAAGMTEGDPGVHVLFQENQKPIDASLYRLFRFKMYVPFNPAGANELKDGAVARVTWKESDTDTGLVTDDLILYPGLRNTWLDLPNTVLEGTSGRKWQNLVRYLRIDPFEYTASRSFYLDSASLHTYPTYASTMPLALSLGGSATSKLTVKVYSDGTEIKRFDGLSPGLQGLDVPLSAVAAGQHTLKVCTEDGINANCNTLPIPFVKTADAAAVGMGDLDSVYDWAESVLPAYLRSAGESSETIAGYYARCYKASGVCLGVKDYQAFLYDGKQIQALGSVTPYIAAARAAGY